MSTTDDEDAQAAGPQGKAQVEGKRSDHLPPLFAAYFLRLQREARRLGYGLMLHGSMMRDLDILAVPWVESAVSAEELFLSLSECLGWNRAHVIPDPAVKPHGRLAYSLWLFNDTAIKEGQRHFFMDLSIMPRSSDWGRFQ